MLDIRANDEDFSISLDPETICSTGMVVPLSGDYGFHIVDAGKVFAGISDLQELEIGPHVIQLHRKIFRLHLDFENLPQIGDCLVPAERQQRDFLFGIISRGKERKALDVVPVKVRERDTDLLLLVADGAKVSAQISQSRAGVNDCDLVRIGDLQAPHTTAPPSSPFPGSFLRTLPCKRPKSRAHWRHWTRTSSFSADHRFAQGIVVSAPSLKRGGKIFAR